MAKLAAFPEPPTDRAFRYSQLEPRAVDARRFQRAVRTAQSELAELMLSQAKQILHDALERYRRPDGYEGYLVEAAWQLEQLGPGAWQVLRKLANENIPECEYFLGAIVRAQGVPPEERQGALLAAARNPDPNSRSRLLELLGEMPRDLRWDVLLVLASKSQPEDSVSERAQEALDSQAS